MVLVGLRQVVDGMGPDIHAAGRDFVEQGLPDVSTGAIDERDPGSSAPRERVAEPGDELKAGGAAAHDDDPVRHHGGSRAFGRTRTHVERLSHVFLPSVRAACISACFRPA